MGEETETAEADKPWWRRERTTVLVAAFVAVLPLLVAIPRVLSKGAFAINGDDALIELRVRDVGSAETPLVGSYQRNGFNHPGPLPAYLLAAPYRLLGAQFSGLQVGVLLLNAASFVGIALVAARRGGVVFALWCLVILSVLARAMGGDRLWDPWEPHMSLFPLALLVLVIAEVAAGRLRLLPLAAFLASVLVQAQLTLAPVVGGLVAWAVIANLVRLWAGRGDESLGDWWRGARVVVFVTAGVSSVLWLPVVIDQLVGVHNAGLIQGYASSPEPKLGFGDAYRAVALQFDHRAWWLSGEVPRQTFTSVVDLSRAPAVPIAPLVLVLAMVVAAIRRRGAAAVVAGTVLVAVSATIVGLSRLTGEVFTWVLESTRVLGAGCWLAAGWCAYRSLPDRCVDQARRVAVPLLAVALVALAGMRVSDAVTSEPSADPTHDAAVDLAEESARSLRSTEGAVLVTSTADVSEIFGAGRFGENELVLALDRAGVDVIVRPDGANRYGEHRAHPERAVREVRLVSGDDRPPGFTVVATADLVPPARAGEVARLTARRDELIVGMSLPEIAEEARRRPELRRIIDRLDDLESFPPLAVLVRDL